MSRPEHAAEAYGLTRMGRRGVERNVASARDEGALPQPVVVVSSPLLRARESAAVAAGLLGAHVWLDSRLTERDFGELEMGPDTLYGQVWEADQTDPTHRRWGVESLVDVLRRVGAAVEGMCGSAPEATVIFCTHGDVASALLCASNKAPLGLHRQLGALETGALRHVPAVEPILEALRDGESSRRADPQR